MSESGFQFKFVVLGDSALINSFDNFTTKNPSAFDMIKRRTKFYHLEFLGSYVIAKQQIKDYLRPEPIQRYIPLFFRGFSAMIFPSKSFDSAQELLREQNRPDLFEFISNQTPIYIITTDKNDLKLINQYKDLMRQYFRNYGDNTPIIIYKGKHNQTLKIMDRIMREFVHLYSKEHYSEYEKLSIFTLCAICREQKDEMHIQDNFVICNSCNPKNYEEGKMQAWSRLDREK